ncbi:MAG: aspartate/glutamate racemase family protein [Gammaproteobacteria bacterium]|nr:aspartate/glutamate racemase family protein [Gammaproteobacteria bacterium]
MKTIGLLGGMSWVSTVSYYRIINETVNAELGGLHSAKILLASVDFHDIEVLQHAGRWDEAGHALGDAAAVLESAGAELLVLCTNTMHKVAEEIASRIRIPLLHIADATAAEISAAGLSSIGLLGTRFTMEEPFYKERLSERDAIEVIVPSAEERTLVHRVIYEELCQGDVLPESRVAFQEIARNLAQRGAGGIILGCTEIGLLLDTGDVDVPLFDTARIHAETAARQSLPGRAIDL